MKEFIIDENSFHTIKSRHDIVKDKSERTTAIIDNSREYSIEKWKDFEFPLPSEVDEVKLLYDNSSLTKLREEALKSMNFQHDDKYHYRETLKEHTQRMIDKLEPNSKISVDMVLFHDIGKPIVASPNPSGTGLCYYNHANIGAREIIKYLSNAEIKEWLDIIYMANYHMAMVNYRFTKTNFPEILSELNKNEIIWSKLVSFAQLDLLKPGKG